MPASGLDYLVIAWVLLLSEEAVPQRVHAVYTVSNLGRLFVLGALIVMCLLRAWGATSPDRGEAAAMAAGDQGAGTLHLITRGSGMG